MNGPVPTGRVFSPLRQFRRIGESNPHFTAEALAARVKAYQPTADTDLLIRAYHYGEQAHRLDGESRRRVVPGADFQKRHADSQGWFLPPDGGPPPASGTRISFMRIPVPSAKQSM